MPYKYALIPHTISYSELVENKYSLSSSLYRKVNFDKCYSVKLRNLLKCKLSKAFLGKEVGSDSYIKNSNKYFVRAVCLNDYSYTLSLEKSVPILPSSFDGEGIKKGDIIISKDSNIGEVCIADKDYENYMLSSALYKLPIKEHRLYVLAMIKSNIFKEELDTLVPKGATIRHAKTLFLDCNIIFPTDSKDQINEIIVNYVEVLTKAIIKKESLIKKRHREILNIIDRELKENQKSIFTFHYPKFSDIKDSRLDAGQYCKEFKTITSFIKLYRNGYKALDEMGLRFIPGPSLEMKILKVRLDSDRPKKGFVRLITPTVISNYGVTIKDMYIGTPHKITPIQKYDILFGESGTGRTMMYLDDDKNVINNAHAHVLRPIKEECDIDTAITIRCILQYYKEIGYTDYMTVGGSGGHLSPSYFDRIYIPLLDNSIKKKISNLYYSKRDIPNINNLASFELIDDEFNNLAGIYELDKTAKILKKRLAEIFDSIMKKEKIDITFY